MKEQLLTLQKLSGSALLTITMWLEADNQGVEGMVAVGHVIRNRVLKPGWWGNTWRSVILHPWQFSCFNEGNEKRVNQAMDLWEKRHEQKNPQFKAARYLSCGIIDGHLPDNTKGANHYYKLFSPFPSWAKGEIPLTLIKDHIFFRL